MDRYSVTGWGSPTRRVWFIYDNKTKGLVPRKQYRTRREAKQIADFMNRKK